MTSKLVILIYHLLFIGVGAIVHETIYDAEYLLTKKQAIYWFRNSRAYTQSVLQVVYSIDDAYPEPVSDCLEDDLLVHTLHGHRDNRPGIRIVSCTSRSKEAYDIYISRKTKHIARTARHTDMASIYKEGTQPRHGMKLTACVPAIFMPPKSSGISSSAVSIENMWAWLGGWMKYNQELGVEHFFIYTVGMFPKPNQLISEVPHTFIDVSWVMNERKRKGGPLIWYYGQYWTINDCLYRNKELGTKWALFQDIDELFQSLPNHTPSLIDAIDSAVQKESNIEARGKRSGVDSIFFGSRVSRTHSCENTLPNALEWSGSKSRHDTCLVDRDKNPECDDKSGNADPNTCPSWKGRRKHIDNVKSVLLTKVHKTLACESQRAMRKSKRGCNEVTVDASLAWLDHYRGSPLQLQMQCRCK